MIKKFKDFLNESSYSEDLFFNKLKSEYFNKAERILDYLNKMLVADTYNYNNLVLELIRFSDIPRDTIKYLLKEYTLSKGGYYFPRGEDKSVKKPKIPAERPIPREKTSGFGGRFGKGGFPRHWGGPGS